MYAANNGKIQMVNLLVHKGYFFVLGPKIDRKNNKDGKTSLMLAAEQGHMVCLTKSVVKLSRAELNSEET